MKTPRILYPRFDNDLNSQKIYSYTHKEARCSSHQTLDQNSGTPKEEIFYAVHFLQPVLCINVKYLNPHSTSAIKNKIKIIICFWYYILDMSNNLSHYSLIADASPTMNSKIVSFNTVSNSHGKEKKTHQNLGQIAVSPLLTIGNKHFAYVKISAKFNGKF